MFGVPSVGGESKETSLGLAAFLLDGDIMMSKLGKIASGLYDFSPQNYKVHQVAIYFLPILFVWI